MDRVKEYLAVAAKYHFWILVTAVLIVAVLSWYQASSAITAQYESQKALVNGKFGDMDRVAAISNHPNQSFLDGAKAQHEVLKRDVLAAWQRLYDQQKDRLAWPQISDSFTRFITGKPWLTPIEPVSLREAYREHVAEHLKDVYKIVQPIEEAARPGTAGEGRPQNVAAGIVDWPPERRRLESHVTWSSTPSSKAIWYAQEDFWVYEHLLRAIAAANRDATDRTSAAVKSIQTMAIGKDAASVPYTLGPIPHASVPARATTSGAGGGAAGGQGGAQQTPEARDAALEANRYVNAQMVPVATEGESGGQYRLMPVALELVVDQRKLFDVLAEFTNSPLPVQIKSVALQPASAVDSSQAAGSTRRRAADGPSDPNELFVLIRGIMYLFNQPSPEQLGIAPEGDGMPGGELGADAAGGGAGALPPDAPPGGATQPDTPPPDGAAPDDAAPDADGALPGAENPAAPAGDAAAPGAAPATEATEPATPAAEPAPAAVGAAPGGR